MAISDAYVDVTCDECLYVQERESLTALARAGEWDERYIEARLKRDGWTVEDDRHLCPECTEEAREPETAEPEPVQP